MVRVAINGMGRIGRAVFRALHDHRDLNLVAVNDIIPIDNMEYLLNYDSIYRDSKDLVMRDEDHFVLKDSTSCRVFAEKDPSHLPWSDMDVDIVMECSGHFTDEEGMLKHIKAGARHVILSAPNKGGNVPMVVPGVNQNEQATKKLLSTASCTTNCIAPAMEILDRRIGVKKANLTTMHAYTSSQSLVDSSHKKMRKGRAAALNFVPTSTGAAKATAVVLPQLKDKFDGMAIRGPVPVGSVADLNILTKRETTAEEINDILREEAKTERYIGIFGVSEKELVSSDIIGDDRASVADLKLTQVVDGDLCKIVLWYDNEWGYAKQMTREAELVAERMEVKV